MIFEVLKQVKAFVFDVDGVFTNGMILMTERGEQLRSFNIKDGYALQLAVKRGYPVAVISGGNSEGVRIRFSNLGVQAVFLGVSDKKNALTEWLTKNNILPEDVLYMGDDIPDLDVMKAVGLAACPSDAAEEIKTISHYVSPKNGGDGAVRDVVEKVMKMQGTWQHDKTTKSI